MCAVFGGIYCLQCKVEAMITDVNSQRSANNFDMSISNFNISR